MSVLTSVPIRVCVRARAYRQSGSCWTTLTSLPSSPRAEVQWLLGGGAPPFDRFAAVFSRLPAHVCMFVVWLDCCVCHAQGWRWAQDTDGPRTMQCRSMDSHTSNGMDDDVDPSEESARVLDRFFDW